jgi:Tol biopolymer transport system component
MAGKPVALTIIFAIAALAAAAPAGATFPGRNGLVAYGAKDGVHVMRSDGTRDRVVSRIGPATDAEWGPSGNRIAFSSGGSIYVVDVRRRTTRRLTFGRYDRHPSWSTHGALLIYARADGPAPGIWRLRMSDGWRSRVLANHVTDAEMSPDGRWIAVIDQTWRPYRVFLLKLGNIMNGGHTLVKFPEGDGQPIPWQLAWSPDSQELAINTDADAAACDGCETLYTVNVDGSGLKAVTREGVIDPFYSPDGTMLAYCSLGYAAPNGDFFMQQQALVHHGDRYVGPTCGESWQARP